MPKRERKRFDIRPVAPSRGKEPIVVRPVVPKGEMKPFFVRPVAPLKREMNRFDVRPVAPSRGKGPFVVRPVIPKGEMKPFVVRPVAPKREMKRSDVRPVGLYGRGCTVATSAVETFPGIPWSYHSSHATSAWPLMVLLWKIGTVENVFNHIEFISVEVLYRSK